jgi:hypothetical protein
MRGQLQFHVEPLVFLERFAATVDHGEQSLVGGVFIGGPTDD